MASTSPERTDAGDFESLGLHTTLLQALAALGYEEPTPIQREAVPPLLAGKDVLGQAATGTGKTAAFALPLLQRLKPGTCGAYEASALVLVPTRELAMQVAEAVHTYGKALGVRVLAVYGGQDIGQQLRRLKQGIDVVVATPGRALDHLRRKTLRLERVGMVVLDEADEMLDMGFAEDLEAILNTLPEGCQTALFSATLPPRIAGMAEQHLEHPVRVRIAPERLEMGEAPRVRQLAYVVPRAFKSATLSRLLDVEAPTSAIIFCRTRTEVDTLTESLNGHGSRAEALHGGMNQEQRDRVLKKFKSHALELLVATDVAARGLHVEKLSHVVNYDLPTSPEVYVHRIGRTGRAGREGVALTLLEPREHRFLRNIERMTGQRIEVATVPSVADLRARRLELTRASIHEALLAGGLDSYRVVVESLAAEHDLMDIAAAAVKLVHQRGGEEQEEVEIPSVAPSSAAPKQGKAGRERAAPFEPPARAGRPVRGEAERRPAARPSRQADPADWETARLFIGAGRAVGVRPGDLVGAIANEAGVESRHIGAIQITDEHALVEVPERFADRILEALRQTTLRGRKVKVRRERG